MNIEQEEFESLVDDLLYFAMKYHMTRNNERVRKQFEVLLKSYVAKVCAERIQDQKIVEKLKKEHDAGSQEKNSEEKNDN